ncbi:MAG: hypothetical protein ACRDTJ_27260, partial [Pseudonocardiaceae bacterium]
EGIVYRYDLIFAFDGVSLPKTLADATGDALLAYLPPYDFPSFCLPPKDPNKLRLIQGSCRIPHGNGKDALAIVDDLIAEAASDPVARPHQLLLTGDQIYADDVAASMLVMLSDAADALLNWKEVLPVPASHGGPLISSKLSPFLRKSTMAGAGFTSEDLDAHLMSLGEYLCMYLFVWSDALWPTTALPSFMDVTANLKMNVDSNNVWFWKKFLPTKKKSIESHIKAMAEFQTSLRKVRRTLANIPSYMIFDDHEVTDDWNMTRDICQGMYSNPLGLRIVQNALVAYALCQHWGNAPEQFEDSGQTPPPAGLTLLQLLENGTAVTYEQNSPTIRSRVGLHDDTALKAQPDNAVFHDASSLLYHFTVESPGHQVIFTDTRTWRSFPNGNDEAPHLLPKNQFTQQILQTPPTGDRALLVVLTTNAPPVQPIRTATRHAWIANFFKHFPDVYESWELPSIPFDRLIKTLTDKLPIVASQRHGAIILLSGDVHTSFASRLLYKATSRFEDPQPQPATAVFAQLVASSLRKQTKDTIGFHREGYRFAPCLVQWLVPKHAREGYVGWNLPVGSGQVVGQEIFGFGDTGVRLPLKLDLPTVSLSEKNIEVQVSPDYSYSLDYLPATTEGVVVPAPISIPSLPPGATTVQRKQAAGTFHQATRSYRNYNTSPSRKLDMVGVNNVSEITFDWRDGDNKKVNHTLHWWNEKLSIVQVTDYVVSLDPDHPQFPEIKPKVKLP